MTHMPPWLLPKKGVDRRKNKYREPGILYFFYIFDHLKIIIDLLIE